MSPTAFNLSLANDTGAILSDCRTYRYALWRKWNNSNPMVMFVGLNPSTADETKDDPTIRRVKSFASGFGYGGVVMVNLFAFRATKPADMLSASDPIGLLNKIWIPSIAVQCRSICCAWGANKNTEKQSEVILTMADELDIPTWCLGITKDGHPRHPLYVKADKAAEPY